MLPLEFAYTDCVSLQKIRCRPSMTLSVSVIEHSVLTDNISELPDGPLVDSVEGALVDSWRLPPLPSPHVTVYCAAFSAGAGSAICREMIWSEAI